MILSFFPYYSFRCFLLFFFAIYKLFLSLTVWNFSNKWNYSDFSQLRFASLTYDLAWQKGFYKYYNNIWKYLCKQTSYIFYFWQRYISCPYFFNQNNTVMTKYLALFSEDKFAFWGWNFLCLISFKIKAVIFINKWNHQLFTTTLKWYRWFTEKGFGCMSRLQVS